MNQPKTEWRTIADFPNYQISTAGECRNIRTNKILRPYQNGSGYLKYKLTANGNSKQLYAHRLVADTFIPNELNLPTVNHRDGNRQNNNKWNLEHASYAMQQADITFRKWFGYQDDDMPRRDITILIGD